MPKHKHLHKLSGSMMPGSELAARISYARNLGRDNALVIYTHVFSKKLLDDRSFAACRDNLYTLYNNTANKRSSVFLVGHPAWMHNVNGILKPEHAPHLYFASHCGSFPFYAKPDGRGGYEICLEEPVPHDAVRKFLELLNECGKVLLAGKIREIYRTQASLSGMLSIMKLQKSVIIAPPDFLYRSPRQEKRDNNQIISNTNS